ncbi:uncharacterized protein AKAW2_60156S [Aspergillus luchuensis]|uniref:RING-type domain-containing protein n=1 Tax=Aspergillus kawachii TaxID=1069201 RepID=A0A146FTT3_ASPKA|nr:uncharacterized protein AKAW2_60156S [Aspergillus luchuensis]BCS01892.1 hypothetical protein AKAW2_60156S [Aspergillus luchuensis]BCS13591.1 hypothetical protein ALUC_60147S [Aspergillus luchuensis]GAA91537.1 hypothetical protein AKAW_09651 [Aspergillus luchuensis IFO 4308]GAT29056.1 hypothetical protein RIB2604_02800280 [Aspergillus luchuensis]
MEGPNFTNPLYSALPIRMGYMDHANADLTLDDNPALLWDLYDHGFYPLPDYDQPMKKQRQISHGSSRSSDNSHESIINILDSDSDDNNRLGSGIESGASLRPSTKSLSSSTMATTSAASRSNTHSEAVYIDLTLDDELLWQITDIFPGISHQHVEELIELHKKPQEHQPAPPLDSLKESVIEDILRHPSYPKQEKAKKRKIEDTDEEATIRYLRDIPERGSRAYLQLATNLLAQEFGWMPMKHIRDVLEEKKELFAAYLTLHSQENEQTGKYTKLKSKRFSNVPNLGKDDKTPIAENLARELGAAKKKAEKEDDALRKKKEKQEAEIKNEEEHSRAGNLIECQCCYLDVPANRSLPCEGDNVHLFCFACIRKSTETQIGLMRYQVQCVDTSGCQAKFSRARLQEAIGESLMEKLDRLQQQDEIQQAELEGLEACPFCEFKAIYPPVEEDREFVCKNPDCEIVSCRLCQQESHIPRTCAEANKEKNLPQRHLVEEAMSEALIRPCPKCKVKIVKDMGCNRMVCSKCRTAMCYVCRRDITRELYEHFERPPTYCPLHDNPALRSLQEIEKAQKDTIDSLLAQNPELKEEELRVHDAKDSAAKMSHVLQGHNNGLIRHLGQAPIHPNHVVYPGPAIPVGRANPPAVAHRVNAPFGNDNGWGGQGWLQNPLGQPRNPPGHPVPTNVVHRGANNRGNPLQDPARRVDTRPPWRY